MSIDEHKTKPAAAKAAAQPDVCPTKRKQLDLATVREQIEDTKRKKKKRKKI